MSMFTLPAYDVVIWHRIESSPPGLHDRILAHAGREPDEGMEMEGTRDMHWGFETAEEATAFADSLLEIAASDDVLVLSIVASKDVGFGRRVYKDTRSFARRSE
jgi:hypothetical protein